MKTRLEQTTETPFTEGNKGNEGQGKAPKPSRPHGLLCYLRSLLLKPALLTAGLVLHNPLPARAAPGDVDPSFDPGSEMDERVQAIAIQSDGKFMIAGCFKIVPGGVRQGVARFNADGTLDTTFADPLVAPIETGWPAGLYGLATQPDGKVVIGGTFTSVNGVTRNHIARLNADGLLDRTFQEGMDGTTGQGGYVYAVESAI